MDGTNTEGVIAEDRNKPWGELTRDVGHYQGIDLRQEKTAKATKIESERAQTRRSNELAIEAWKAYVGARKSDWGKRHLRNHVKLAQAGGLAGAQATLGGSCARCRNALRLSSIALIG